MQHSVEAVDGDCEGTPVGVLEAGGERARGGIHLTRRALPDVVADGRTGILVEEGDVEAMAAGMTRLAHDGRLAATLGQAARTRIESHFSMDQSIQRLASILEGATRG